VLRLAFERYGMHRVEAQMDARNVGSASLCSRIGMMSEGLRRRDWWSKGEWTDSLTYAALSTDAPRDHGDAIVVSAVTLRDADGRVLTVRKRGTGLFMQPGGKPDPGESPEACALREVHEELGLTLDPRTLELTGVHRTAAANEAGRPLLATVFAHPHLSSASAPEVTPEAEIEEVRWLDPRRPLPDDIAPLLRSIVTPSVDR
jgi:8-oxo-dGTP pyrophosphatase MutT (NUDIX family)